jgi:pilus assembly protein Flp/PilA
MSHIINIIRDTRGATAIEYGLIAALIAVAAISAMSTLGGKVAKSFNNVATNMKAS